MKTNQKLHQAFRTCLLSWTYLIISGAAALGIFMALGMIRNAEARGQETVTLGVITVTADSITDLGGGLSQAVGNIRLGNSYYLLGAGDTVIIDQNLDQIRASGSLAYGSGQGALPLVYGPFSASGFDGVLVPGAGMSFELALAGFDLLNPVMTIHLDTSMIQGVTDLYLTPDDQGSTAQDVAFTLASGPVLTGTVPVLQLNASGVILNAVGAVLDNQGISAAVAQLTLPAALGGGQETVTDLLISPGGLGVNGGMSFDFPDIKFGDGAHLSIVQNTGKLVYDSIEQDYQFEIDGTLTINFPENSQTAAISLILEQHNGQPALEGTLDQLTFNMAQATLEIDNIVITIQGLSAAQALLSLPPQLGSGQAEVFDITIDGASPYIHIGGGAVQFPLPPMRIGTGKYVQIHNGLATLVVVGSAYNFTASVEVDITLPENNLATADVALTLANGRISAELATLNMQMAGMDLQATNLTLANDGLTGQLVTLTLPPELGGETASLGGFHIGDDGFTFQQAQLTFPTISIGSPQAVIVLSGSQATYRLLSDQSGYAFHVTSQLTINLPDNPPSQAAFVFNLAYSRRQGYTLSGGLPALNLNVAGASLAMNALNFDNTGFHVSSATLSLPLSLGGEVVTLAGVSITAAGLVIGAGQFEMPDLSLDSDKIRILDPVATLSISGTQYAIHAQGTLSVTLPENSLNASFSFALANGGQVSGTIPSLQFNLAGLTLDMNGVVISNTGFAAADAILTAPPDLGSAQVTIDLVSVNNQAPFFHFGAADLDANLPDIRFGQAAALISTTASLDITTTLDGSTPAYILTADTILDLNLPDNNAQQDGITFTLVSQVGGGALVDGQISALDLDLAGTDLQLRQVDISNQGLSVSSATLAMPAGLGGEVVTIQGVSITGSAGLYFSQATLTLPDIVFNSLQTASSGKGGGLAAWAQPLNAGSTPPLALRGNTAMLAVTGASPDQHYQFSIVSTINVNLPGNSFTSPFSFTMTPGPSGYLLNGALGQLNLDIAGATLAMSNLQLGNAGLSVSSATLTLPPALGDSVTLNNVSITAQGLQLGGATFQFPLIHFGGGANSLLKVTNVTASLSSSGGTYVLSGRGTLAINLPENSETMTLQFTLSAGQFSASLSNFTLTVAGATLALNGITVSNTGLLINSATLTLPSSLGQETVQFNNIAITHNGLDLGGTFTLPYVPLGNGQILNFSNLSADLTVDGAQYSLVSAGTLNVNLPGSANKLAIQTTITIDPQGVSGALNGLTLQVAGGTLALQQIGLSSSGLSAGYAYLQLPADLGGESLAVSGVSITPQGGLQIQGGTLALPSMSIGSALQLLNPTASFQTVSGGYTFAIAATLALSLPQNSQSIAIKATLDTQGQFSALISQLSITLAKETLSLQNVQVNNQGLLVASGTLALANDLGGLSGTVTNISLDRSGKFNVGGVGGVFPLPNLKLGGAEGFQVTGANGYPTPVASLALAADHTFSMIITGTVAVVAPGINVSAAGQIYRPANGSLSGTVNGFQVGVAGLQLLVTNVQINNDTLSAAEASLSIPLEWQSSTSGSSDATVAVYNVSFSPANGLAIGGGSFTLPTIHAGGFTIQASGALIPVSGGYQISASGFFGIKGLGLGTGGCGIGASLTLYDTGTGAQIDIAPTTPLPRLNRFELQRELRLVNFENSFEGLHKPDKLQLQYLMVEMVGCAIPIGDTGFSVTGLSGSITLDTSTTIIQVGVTVATDFSLPVIGPALSYTGTATLDTGAEQISFAGALKAFAWTAASGQTVINRTNFSATLSVNAIVAYGNLSLDAWDDQVGFHITGSGQVTLGIARRSILNWIPKCDLTLASTTVQAGEFVLPDQSTAYGLKGTAQVLSFLNWGFFIDDRGDLTFSNLKEYSLYTPTQVDQAREKYRQALKTGLAEPGQPWQSGDLVLAPDSSYVGINVVFTQTDRVVFHFAVDGSQSSRLYVYNPYGEYVDDIWCLTNCTSSVNHSLTVGSSSSDCSNHTEEYYTVDVYPGTWQARLYYLPSGDTDYQFTAVSQKLLLTPPVFGGTSYSVSGTNITAGWQMTSTVPSTTVTLHAVAFISNMPPFYPVTSLCPYTDFTVGTVNTKIDGSWNSSTFAINSNILPSGTFAFYLAANDTFNLPVNSDNPQNYGCVALNDPRLFYVNNGSSLTINSSSTAGGKGAASGELAAFEAPAMFQRFGPALSGGREEFARPAAAAAPESSWDADLVMKPGYRMLTVQWDRYRTPGMEGYTLYLSETPGGANPLEASRTITVGKVTSAAVMGLKPGQKYYAAVRAYNRRTYTYILSTEEATTALTAPFDLQAPAEAVDLPGGGAAQAAITLTTALQPYPDGVGLSLGCASLQPSFHLYLPYLAGGSAMAGSGARVQESLASSVTCQSLDGLRVSFSTPVAAPSTDGMVVTVYITASESLPGGLYRLPLVARGGGETRTAAVLVNVNEPRYSLNADPGSATLQRGQSTQVILSAQAVNGELDPIRLKLDSAPIGLAWSFSDLYLLPGQNVTLTVRDTSGLKHGQYPLTISGFDGDHQETTVLTLTVDKPSFVIQPVEALQTASPGGAAMYALDLLSVDGWNQPVTLTVDQSSLPPHATAGFVLGPAMTNRLPPGQLGWDNASAPQAQITVTPPQQVYLGVMLAADTPMTRYTVRLSATGSILSSSTRLSLQVKAATLTLKTFLPFMVK